MQHLKIWTVTIIAMLHLEKSYHVTKTSVARWCNRYSTQPLDDPFLAPEGFHGQ